MCRVANSRRDGEAGPGSKREAGCEAVGRAEIFRGVMGSGGKWMVLSMD
jgi:hypothetical protein